MRALRLRVAALDMKERGSRDKSLDDTSYSDIQTYRVELKQKVSLESPGVCHPRVHVNENPRPCAKSVFR